MPLPLFLQRLRQRSAASGADANLPLSSAELELARVRARRRLVGMVVLVGVGVVGLPWLFETQPRPLNPDVQVVSAVAPRGSPAGISSGSKPSIAAVTVPVSPVEDEVIEEPAMPASKPVARPSDAPAVPPAPPPVPAKLAAAPSTHPPAAATTNSSKTAARETTAKPPAPDAAPSKDAARARALLDGKLPAAAQPAAKADPDPANTRYVVQIGAFSDVTAVREIRLKAERAGVKTYTQEVTVNGSKKTRVRVGPYANKADADKAVDTLRKAGISSALLTL